MPGSSGAALENMAITKRNKQKAGKRDREKRGEREKLNTKKILYNYRFGNKICAIG